LPGLRGIDDARQVVEADHGRRQLEPGRAQRDRRTRPPRDAGVRCEHQQDHRTAQLRAQRRDVDRPGPLLVRVELQLDLDDHRGDRLAFAIAQLDDGIGAVLGRDHLRQVDRSVGDAILTTICRAGQE
jgi:non-ribosomal peptide synthetase component F